MSSLCWRCFHRGFLFISERGLGHVHLGTLFGWDGHYGLLDHRGPAFQAKCHPVPGSDQENVASDVGCLPGWSLYLWPCVRVQFFGHSRIACVRVLQDRTLVHHCSAHPRLDWRCTLRHNMAWTLILLIYLILIGVLFYLFFPGVMSVV